MISSQQEILDSSSGVPWPVLVFIVLTFATIQYIGPKLIERWRSPSEEHATVAEAEKAKYEGAAAFIDATGAYGIQILEQLTRVQDRLEDEKNERNRLERNLARAFGVIGILEEELNHMREEVGKPPVTDRIKRMFPELYEMMPDYMHAAAASAKERQTNEGRDDHG